MIFERELSTLPGQGEPSQSEQETKTAGSKRRRRFCLKQSYGTFIATAEDSAGAASEPADGRVVADGAIIVSNIKITRRGM